MRYTDWYKGSLSHTGSPRLTWEHHRRGRKNRTAKWQGGGLWRTESGHHMTTVIMNSHSCGACREYGRLGLSVVSDGLGRVSHVPTPSLETIDKWWVLGKGSHCLQLYSPVTLAGDNGYFHTPGSTQWVTKCEGGKGTYRGKSCWGRGKERMRVIRMQYMHVWKCQT